MNGPSFDAKVQPSLEQRAVLMQAIRGPIMLITLGILVSLDYFQGISFTGRTWPVLLIVFGLMKLLEKSRTSARLGGPAI